jgi:hypothetical protein
MPAGVFAHTWHETRELSFAERVLKVACCQRWPRIPIFYHGYGNGPSTTRHLTDVTANNKRTAVPADDGALVSVSHARHPRRPPRRMLPRVRYISTTQSLWPILRKSYTGRHANTPGARVEEFADSRRGRIVSTWLPITDMVGKVSETAHLTDRLLTALPICSRHALQERPPTPRAT